MLSEAKNHLLTRVGPGAPMGQLLRRHWMPIAGLSEFDPLAIKPIRLLGEDLVLYRDLSGGFGLIGRYCAHRRADLAMKGLSMTEIMANPAHRQALLSYILQAGQPEAVRLAFSEAMGAPAQDYAGPLAGKPFMDASAPGAQAPPGLAPSTLSLQDALS